MSDFWVPEGMGLQEYLRSPLRDMQEHRLKRRIVEEAKAREAMRQQTAMMQQAPQPMPPKLSDLRDTA